MKHFNVTFKPDDKQISVHAGTTVLEAAGQAGIILNSICGGKGTCKKCIVEIEPNRKQVLACQHHIQSNLIVTIPASSMFFEQKILKNGIDIHLSVRPTIHEKYRAKESTEEIFGLAVDIGTTTVVVKLINIMNGQCLATQAALNPQCKYGDDVVSRIAYARTDDKLRKLHKLIIDCINNLIVKLCKETSTDTQRIYEACFVGNTTMNHIFLKLPIEQLGRSPYKAFTLDAHDTPAGELKLQINPDANVHTVENIAGFVGSDITAVALATGIDSDDKVTLILDIGTNGEVVLGTKDKLYAASCAAGPAFEGARISCGSRAVEGAIEAVAINEEDIDLDVIGNCPPRSICGSGLIDAVAVLLNLGIVDKSGRFTKPGKLVPAIAERIFEQDKQLKFHLHRAANVSERDLFLTQKDIREVQLAKAAIRAGVKILQQKLGIEDADIEQILLAGAFGNYIRPKSALRIGLLPTVPVEKIRFVGNAASSGAQMILLNSALRAKAKQLARKIEYIEIANEPNFQTIFTESLSF